MADFACHLVYVEAHVVIQGLPVGSGRLHCYRPNIRMLTDAGDGVGEALLANVGDMGPYEFDSLRLIHSRTITDLPSVAYGSGADCRPVADSGPSPGGARPGALRLEPLTVPPLYLSPERLDPCIFKIGQPVK